MKSVVDAQLPPRLARHLVALGHDAVHVESLPGGESQPDADIAAYADAEGRVVVTKDADFRHSVTISATRCSNNANNSSLPMLPVATTSNCFGVFETVCESVVPDATLGRMLRQTAADSFESGEVRGGQAASKHSSIRRGTPTVLQSGPAPIPSRLATVSFLNLGDVQLWTLGWTLLPAIAHRFPSRLTPLHVGLRSRQLRTYAGDADPTSVAIDYGAIDIRPLLKQPVTDG